jgi:small subunit ribosomal protein S6
VNENQREYETVFILDPGLEEAKVNEEIERAEAVIKDHGGNIEEVERWGRRRLAYEIGRKRDGVYTLIRYHAGGPAVKELERRMRLNESVLRALTVVVDPRYKEMMQQLAANPPVEGVDEGEGGGDSEGRGGMRRGGRFRDHGEGGDEDDSPRPRRRSMSEASEG